MSTETQLNNNESAGEITNEPEAAKSKPKASTRDLLDASGSLTLYSGNPHFFGIGIGGGELPLKAEVKAGASVDAKASLNTASTLQVAGNPDAPIAANAKVGAEIQAKADAQVKAQANVDANIGGTGTPLAVQLLMRLSKSRIKLNVPKIGVVCKLFGLKLFEFRVDGEAQVDIESD